MLSPFPAKQGGCYTVGHFEYGKVHLIFCAPCLLSKTHFQSAAQGQSTEDTVKHRPPSRVQFQMPPDALK